MGAQYPNALKPNHAFKSKGAGAGIGDGIETHAPRYDDSRFQATSGITADEAAALGASTTPLTALNPPVSKADLAASGPVVAKEITFTATGAGTYTGTVVVPAGATVLDVIVRNTVLWDSAVSASLVVGDGDDPNGYVEATDVTAAPLADTNGAGEGLSSALSLGATIGAYKGGAGKFCAAQKTITATLVATGAGNAGRTRVLVVYAAPASTAATKA